MKNTKITFSDIPIVTDDSMLSNKMYVKFKQKDGSEIVFDMITGNEVIDIEA
jgi:hypothetical protein